MNVGRGTTRDREKKGREGQIHHHPILYCLQHSLFFIAFIWVKFWPKKPCKSANKNNNTNEN